MSRMTRVAALAVLAVVTLYATWPSTAGAQVPTLKVYFYNSQDNICLYCDPYHPGPDYDFTLSFVLVGANAWVTAIEFSVDYAWSTWHGDVHNATLVLGTSPDGVAMTWSTPQEGHNPLLVMQANITHHAFCSAEEKDVATVRPHGVTGQLRAIRWPENQPLDLTGGVATMCGRPVPVETSTWGRVKALYR